METVIVVVCLSAALNLALWAALYRKLDRFPAALRAQVRRERAEAQAEAMTVLQAAAALKVGAITAALRAREEEAATLYRDEVAAADLRTRIAERRAADAAPMLRTASELLRQLRELLNPLVAAAGKRTVPPPPEPDPDARPTLETAPPASCAPPPLPAGDEPEEELTTFYDAPEGGVPRPVMRPPPNNASPAEPSEAQS